MPSRVIQRRRLRSRWIFAARSAASAAWASTRRVSSRAARRPSRCAVPSTRCSASSPPTSAAAVTSRATDNDNEPDRNAASVLPHSGRASATCSASRAGPIPEPDTSASHSAGESAGDPGRRVGLPHPGLHAPLRVERLRHRGEALDLRGLVDAAERVAPLDAPGVEVGHDCS